MSDRARDFVLARLGVARALLASATTSIDECTMLFVEPDEDAKGKDRKEMIEAALDAASAACRALEAIDDKIDDAEMAEREPWDEEEGDEEDAH